jgi:glucose/arabinose dehydrogenase
MGVACLLTCFHVTETSAAGPQQLLTGLAQPSAVTVANDGKVYLAIAGEAVKENAGSIVLVEGDKTTPLATGLSQPMALVPRAEWLFVACKGGVWRIDRNDKDRNEMAEAFAPASSFPSPPQSLVAIDVDEKGQVYVADAGGGIYRIDSDAGVTAVVDGKDMPGIRSPGGIVMDGLSHILVTDSSSGVLSRIRLQDGTVTEVARGAVGPLAWDKFGRLLFASKNGSVMVIPRPGEAPVEAATGFQSVAGLAVNNGAKSVLVVDAKAGSVSSIPDAVPGREIDESPLPIETAVAFPDLQWAGWKNEDDKGKTVALRPVVLTHAGDSSNRVFVGTQHGVIHVFPNDQKATKTKVFLDIQEKVTYIENKNEEGFLGLAFHPDYKKNGEFFVFYTPKAEKKTNIISRFRVSKNDPDRADPDSEEVILRITNRPFWNHDGGTLCFGRDGYLYIAVGDGGLANDPYRSGQNLKKLLAKVLRIDINRKEGDNNYAIPPDNPFVNTPDARPEIWAYGLRNVWRMAFDDKTGKLWASDVGQNLYEEIDIIVRGGNYGWNLREGLHPFGVRGTGPQPNLIEPIWEYHHDIGKSLTGGLVYRGMRLPELEGYYLYADYVSAKIWALKYDDDKGRVVANRPIRDPNVPVMSFGEDEKHEAYFLTYSAVGKGIYRFVRASGKVSAD